MRDFAAYVRRHLPAAGLSAERYDAIVDELAAELEARYTKRLREGGTEEDAWNAAGAEIPSWPELARDSRNHPLVPDEPEPSAIRAHCRCALV